MLAIFPVNTRITNFSTLLRVLSSLFLYWLPNYGLTYFIMNPFIFKKIMITTYTSIYDCNNVSITLCHLKFKGIWWINIPADWIDSHNAPWLFFIHNTSSITIHIISLLPYLWTYSTLPVWYLFHNLLLHSNSGFVSIIFI